MTRPVPDDHDAIRARAAGAAFAHDVLTGPIAALCDDHAALAAELAEARAHIAVLITELAQARTPALPEVAAAGVGAIRCCPHPDAVHDVYGCMHAEEIGDSGRVRICACVREGCRRDGSH